MTPPLTLRQLKVLEETERVQRFFRENGMTSSDTVKPRDVRYLLEELTVEQIKRTMYGLAARGLLIQPVRGSARFRVPTHKTGRP